MTGDDEREGWGGVGGVRREGGHAGRLAWPGRQGGRAGRAGGRAGKAGGRWRSGKTHTVLVH
jgi:hypothetical protein